MGEEQQEAEKAGREEGRSLTCGHRTDQDRVQLDDGAEDVLAVGGAGHVLAVEPQDESLVQLLQQDQDVLQEDGVELWEDSGGG